MYTQCPQCLTYFQVTPEHLKVAQGNVRCGQCSNVFSALGNLTELPQEAITDDLNSTTAVFQENMSASFEDFEQDLTSGGNTKEEMQERDNLVQTTEKSGLGAAIDAIKRLNTDDNAIKNLIDGRKKIIEKLKKAPQPPEKKKAPVAKKAPAAKKAVKKRVKKTPPAPQPPQPKVSAATLIQDAKYGNIDVDQALLAIDELDISEDIQANAYISDEDFFGETVQMKTSHEEPAATPRARPPIAEAIPEDPPVKIKSLDRTTAQNNMLVPVSSGFGLQVIPKPLLEDFQQARARANDAGAHTKKHKISIWTMGSILLMLVFLVQTIIYKHDDLARISSIRPWIEALCNQANCEISLPFEARKLELLGQDIRSHPKIKKALLVSVTIINNARYAHAYPGLQITFTDMNDQKVAMRRFLPTEYLKKLSKLATGMRSNTPVQVELELLDPGSKAVNFEFSFFRAS